MKLRWRRFPERGAAAILVALLFGSGAILGMGALTVDVGRIYVTRERLQSGADAAADYVAKSCAAGGCTNSTQIGTLRTQAQTSYVNPNAARPGVGADVEVCGNWGYFASSSGCSIPLNGLSQCLGTGAGDTYVEVHVRTKMSNGSTLLPPTFGTALMGSSYHGKTVTACARVKATATTTTTTGSPPAAVWSNTTSNVFPGSLWLHATTLTVSGLVHANADLYIDATNSTVSPRVEYVTNSTVMVSGVSTPVKVSSGQPTGKRVFADYQPGGVAAVAAGTHYMTATCSGGTWTYNGSGIAAGTTIVYVPCNAVINKTLTAMVAATGTITVSASSINIGNSAAANTTGLLSNSNNMTLQAPAITLSGSSVNVYGNIQALNGMVSLASSQVTYKCGVIGNAVYVAGSIVNITSDSTCGTTTTVTNATGGIPRLSG